MEEDCGIYEGDDTAAATARGIGRMSGQIRTRSNMHSNPPTAMALAELVICHKILENLVERTL